MTINLQIDNLRLQPSSYQPNAWCITHPTCSGADTVYTVARIEWDEDGCDLHTIGQRPWTMTGTTVEQFMAFAQQAMTLIDSYCERQEAADSDGVVVSQMTQEELANYYS